MSALSALLSPHWLEEEKDISLSKIPTDLCNVILMYDSVLYSITASHPSKEEMDQLVSFRSTVLDQRCRLCVASGNGSTMIYPELNYTIPNSLPSPKIASHHVAIYKDICLLGVRSIFELVKKRCKTIHLPIQTAYDTTLRVFDDIYLCLTKNYVLHVCVTYLEISAEEFALDTSSIRRKMNTPHMTPRKLQSCVKQLYEMVRKGFEDSFEPV